MHVLLLGGYRNQPLGLGQSKDGEVWIDYQIQSLKALGLSPIVVLAGAHADDVLRASRHLESCELVFDTNGREANLFSNLRAGLHVTKEACFVLPLEIPAPPESAWKQLKLELVQHGLSTSHHVFQLPMSEGAPWQYGFPLLVTAAGSKTILNLKNATGLTDERIGYRRSRVRTLATPA